MSFPEDLKREVSRYLHKKYYDIVLDELLLMIEPLANILNTWNNGALSFNGVTADKVYVDIETGCTWYSVNRPPHVPVARWILLSRKNAYYTRKSIQEIKIEVNKTLIK